MEGILGLQVRGSLPAIDFCIPRNCQAIPSDHSEFMVQALQLDVGYRESFLGVAGKQALTGERLARVSPTPVST